MSKENVELVRTSFNAFKRGDFDEVIAMADPGIVIVQPRDMPDGSTYHGHEGLLAAFRDWPAQWDEFSVELIDVIDVSETQAVSVAQQRLRARDMELDQQVAGLHTIERGRHVRWDMFLSVDAALAASRASPS